MNNFDQTPNRAPNFKELYGSKERFLAKKSHRAIHYPALGKLKAIESLESLIQQRRLPMGFSNRRFSGAISRMVGGKIVSEHEGRITKLLITVPRSKSKLSPRHARHYGALFRGMGSWCSFVVLCDPDNVAEIVSVAQLAGVAKERLTFALSPNFDFSIWAQDAYVALNDVNGNSILLEGVAFVRYDDMTVADDVSAQTDVSHLQSYLYFQGGNVLGSSTHTLIGMDYIQHNVGRFELETLEKVVASFSLELGAEVIPLGGELFEHYDWYERQILSGHGYQPIFHIDMYVTPTGVVGQSGKEIVFLGRPEEAKRIVGKYSDVSELNSSLYNSLFDKTEEQLRQIFEVRYLPLWLTKGRLNQPSFEERYYNLTFNNCIVQNHSSKKSVLLPFYSQDAGDFGTDRSVREALELAAKQSWEALGFEVAFMDGIEELAYGSGAVHCITKTLSRAI